MTETHAFFTFWISDNNGIFQLAKELKKSDGNNNNKYKDAREKSDTDEEDDEKFGEV